MRVGIIGRDMYYEASESRALILSWLSRASVYISVFALVASLVVLYAAIKQVQFGVDAVVVKPSGHLYSVFAYTDVNKAFERAKASVGIQSSSR